MKLLDTKIGKILATDWIELFFDKLSLKMYESKLHPYLQEKERLIEYKKLNGLNEDERLFPEDGKCNLDYIQKVTHLMYGYTVDGNGQVCVIDKQKVIYIDDTYKIFSVYKTQKDVYIKEIDEQEFKVIKKRS